MAGGFPTTQLKGGWTAGSHSPRKRAALGAYIERIPPAFNVAELGPEDETLARHLLDRQDSIYRSFDVDPVRVADMEQRLTRFPGRAFASVIGPNCVLPLPDSSQDLLLSCHVLEDLRMDQLYMLCSEARRILKAGGHWLLASRHPGSNPLERGISRALALVTGTKSMELTHYISPEDWETVFDEKVSSIGTSTQFLLLRRLAG